MSQEALACQATPESRPEDAIGALVSAIAARDPKSAARCFGRDACFVTPDSTIVHGRDAIGAVLGQLTSTGTRMGIEVESLVVAGAIAQGRGRTTITRPEAGAAAPEGGYPATFVLAWLDGTWKIQILSPWSSW